MTLPVRISYVKKSNKPRVHERIEFVGWQRADGSIYWVTEADAIAGIKADKWDFYVLIAGRAVTVFIAKSEDGHEYLKTLMDGYWPDNLLSLPEGR